MARARVRRLREEKKKIEDEQKKTEEEEKMVLCKGEQEEGNIDDAKKVRFSAAPTVHFVFMSCVLLATCRCEG